MVRNTRQGNAIRQTLKKTGRPLSAQEVLNLAQKKSPRLGDCHRLPQFKIAAAGRFGRRRGIARPVAAVGTSPGKHHHHFLCNTCDKLYEINACPADLQRLLPEGYTLEEHDILLRGLCNDCSVNKNLTGNKKLG